MTLSISSFTLQLICGITVLIAAVCGLVYSKNTYLRLKTETERFYVLLTFLTSAILTIGSLIYTAFAVTNHIKRNHFPGKWVELYDHLNNDDYPEYSDVEIVKDFVERFGTSAPPLPYDAAVILMMNTGVELIPQANRDEIWNTISPFIKKKEITYSEE